MHAIRGGWVGQTFALAKGNDSERRKSRIRRSKEERKEMVESFIKKYQKSNDGNFPSLNLTHKEVGGSFYTVREIVREIIQENKVLGPAKLIPEDQNMVQLHEQYPLGSISSEPQAHLLTLVETDSEPNQIRGEALVLDSTRKYTEPENHMVDSGQMIVNGYHVEEKNEESDTSILAELVVAETSGAKNITSEEVETPAARVLDIVADVFVETFPLRSITKPSYIPDGGLGEESSLRGISEERDIEKVNIEAEKGSLLDEKPSVEDPFGLVDEKAVTRPVGSSLGMNSGLNDEEVVENVTDPLVDSCNTTSIDKDFVHYDKDGIGLEVKMSHCDSLSSDTFEKSHDIAENQNLGSPNGNYSKNMNGSSTSSSSGKTFPKETIDVEKEPNNQDGSSPHKGSNPTLDRSNYSKNMNGSSTSSSSGKTFPKETIDDEKEPNAQDGSSPHKGCNPTLNRINLESWEGSSRKSTELESNPFLAFVKAFVSAFVKFWSE